MAWPMASSRGDPVSEKPRLFATRRKLVETRRTSMGSEGVARGRHFIAL